MKTFLALDTKLNVKFFKPLSEHDVYIRHSQMLIIYEGNSCLDCRSCSKRYMSLLALVIVLKLQCKQIKKHCLQ